MNQNTTGNKALAYAYPTSPQASALGYRDSGCWYVEIVGEVVFAHREMQPALDYWRELPNPVSVWCHTNSPEWIARYPMFHKAG